MNPPENTKIYKGEVATFWFDETGILISKPTGKTRNMSNMPDNFVLVKQIVGNIRRPLLIYMDNSPLPDKETNELIDKEIPNVYKAVGLVATSGIKKIIMNLLFGLKPRVIPMKAFTSDSKAKQWLQSFL